MAKQLLNLAIDSNIGDQAALEFIVNALVSKGEISSSMTSALCRPLGFLDSIKKDKLMEALVDKLGNRFSGVTKTKQWEYIWYSLSLLTFTEKGIKKLIESFKSYEYALAEDLVTENCRSIINKFAKQNLKRAWKSLRRSSTSSSWKRKKKKNRKKRSVKEEPVQEYDQDEDASDSEIVDPAMEEAGNNLKASNSEEETDSERSHTTNPLIP
ncbi:Condensin complex subunit 1 [Raphanus sativus]|nr:Condensin complex subunit 1 [Raphanus sativus]